MQIRKDAAAIQSLPFALLFVCAEFRPPVSFRLPALLGRLCSLRGTARNDRFGQSKWRQK